MFRIALAGIRARKWRLIATSIAIVFGVAFISGTDVLSGVLTKSVGDLVNDAYKGVDGVVRDREAQENPFSSQPIRAPLNAEVVDLVRSTAGVREATGVIQIPATLLDKNDKPVSSFGPPTFVFNWITDDVLAPGTLTEGVAPVGPDQAVIDFKTAGEYGFKLGDPVTISLNNGRQTFTIVGIGGIGADGKKSAGSRIVLIDTTRLQELANLQAKFNSVELSIKDGENQVAVRDRLTQILPPNLEAKTGEEFIAENQAQVAQLTGIITDFVAAFGWVAAFVGTFVIYNTFSILIAQRTRELALLRAVGASRRQLLGSVLIEAFATGLVASTAGLFGGLALATLLQQGLGGFITVPSGVPALTFGAVWKSFAVGVLATMISAVIPAYRATRVPPVAAMSDIIIETSGVGKARIVFGALFTLAGAGLLIAGVEEVVANPLPLIGGGAALLFIAIAVIGPLIAGQVSLMIGRPAALIAGLPGRLARQNAARNPKRTTATGVALTIGVALVVMITVVAASIQQSFSSVYEDQLAADVIIDAGGFGSPVPPTVRETIANVPGVESATAIRFAGARFLDTPEAKRLANRSADEIAKDPTGEGRPTVTGPTGEDVFLLSTEPVALKGVIDLGAVVPGPEALVDNTILVSEGILADNGWTVGQQIRLWTVQSGETTWTVAGSISKQFGRFGYVINTGTYNSITTPDARSDNQLFAKLAPGTDLATMKVRISEAVKDQAVVRVLSVREFVGELADQIQLIINIIYLLLSLAVIVALIGISVTISLSIFERRREIGLLRAVGMRRSQLRRSIRWEAAIIATFGSVLGLGMGTLFGALLVRGFSNNNLVVNLVLPWLSLTIIMIIGAMIGVVAAIWTAFRASRMDILAAISVA